MSMIVPAGFVVGRFQPLHFGHQEYIVEACRRCTKLFVGITNPDPGKYHLSKAYPHRSKREGNPFSFDLRRAMVTELMNDYRRLPEEYCVVPFRLESPASCAAVIPIDTVAFITIYDDWGLEKVDLLKQIGYRVEILWRRRETITRGTIVRSALRSQDQEWKHLVPPSTTRVLEAWLNAGNVVNGLGTKELVA
jgi:cytidyltransferase-like protein